MNTTNPPADLVWVKSSYSGAEGGNCVEVATEPMTVHVRDSKNLQGSALALSGTQWGAFVDWIGA
ncbi:DUF397 domain-containing protein [Streptomyces sp. NPDC059037]|uniref:DUF397 domain-containing protein n=1 Tax=Streptomyces sp. NPDC059037 TaxID=3346710 RepID=UPI0036CA6E0E